MTIYGAVVTSEEASVSESGSDVAAWARAHKASFEVTPLVESNAGKKVHVGFTLTLYAQIPMDKTPGGERTTAAGELWQRLREVVQTFTPKEGGRYRVDIEPPRSAAVLRPENELKPEIALNARIFHADATFAEVTPAERDQLGPVTKRLTEMGLKQGHW